jgi:hypothetical protein
LEALQQTTAFLVNRYHDIMVFVYYTVHQATEVQTPKHAGFELGTPYKLQMGDKPILGNKMTPNSRAQEKKSAMK